MAIARTPSLGAPGVFVVPPEPIREITGVRRDIAAFFGVAPRGPARIPPINQLQPDSDIASWLRDTPVRRSVPVRISSWEEYQYHFGGFEGPGRLPYAVSAFFAQGGQEAYVVRIVADDRDGDPLDGRASSLLGDLTTVSGVPVRLYARSEGSWGNRLQAELSFATRAIEPLVDPQLGDRHFWVDEFEHVPVGSVLLLRSGSGPDALTFVDQSFTMQAPTGSVERRLTLLDDIGSDLLSIDVVTGILDVVDLDPAYDRRERIDQIGFHPAHPRSLARVLIEESTLLWPAPDWPAETLHIDDTELRPLVLEMPGVGAAPRGWLRPLRVANGSKIVLEARDDRGWAADPIQVRARLLFEPISLRDIDQTQLAIAGDRAPPTGSMLRLTRPGGGWLYRYVISVTQTTGPGGVGIRWCLDVGSDHVGEIEQVDLVTMSLEVLDGENAAESWERLGLHPSHPRWFATVVDTESDLVQSTDAWRSHPLLLSGCPMSADGVMPDGAGQISGIDRWDRVEPRDFWDPEWVPGDDEPGSGVHAIALLGDVGLVVTPDLYDPLPLDPPARLDDPLERCGVDFGPHDSVNLPQRLFVESPAMEKLRRDPRVPKELDDILEAQSALAEFAEQQRAWTLLLDVPLGLGDRRIRPWRNQFDSAYAAAYHPWLDAGVATDARDTLITMNPSAFAAGIIADRELRFGVQNGPANEIAVDAVRQTTYVSPQQHDDLHPAGINVFLPERDGVRLTGARTMSRRRSLRQLNVARLMTVIRLSLERDMAWTVFEPNNQALWAEVRRMVTSFLERLYEASAFAGATTSEAFFVRCDRTTITQIDLDNGRMLCEVGVAPSEPLEFISVTLANDRHLYVTSSTAK